ncbi:hypothetical protein ACFOD4_00685 [Pseudoroseomonas globiformis]|uniref:Lipoprotein n=1 Tax=Teichococcus globiformis TaxID=2307229 RepID=A0ABV7FT92_9PROT
MKSVASRAPLWLALALPAALAACAKPDAPLSQSTRPVYAVDMMGAAKTCTVEDNPRLIDARETEVPMALTNDGGWCGLRVSRPGPAPFDAGLLTARPSNGRVRVQAVGDWTRIDYIPDAGFAGEDSFVVRLLPGSTTVKVNAKVEGGAATAAASQPVVTPAATRAQPVTSPAPARSSTPSKATPPARRAR